MVDRTGRPEEGRDAKYDEAAVVQWPPLPENTEEQPVRNVDKVPAPRYAVPLTPSPTVPCALPPITINVSNDTITTTNADSNAATTAAPSPAVVEKAKGALV